MAQTTVPSGAKSIGQILAGARSRLVRVTPETAQKSAQVQGAVLIDIRPQAQREYFGEVPGAIIIERNVLEWRLDPQSSAHLKDVPGVGTYEFEPIVMCQEGYTSSLAAAALQDLGLAKATDMAGGFKAWKEAGLPTTGGEGNKYTPLLTMTSPSVTSDSGSLLVQIASYNTNLQGSHGTPQDLVDWLSPTLSASHSTTPPDIIAVGFQELLPLHLGLTGLSHNVVATRDELLRCQIEKHNSVNGEPVSYTLVAKAVYVGVALLVYARDHGIGQRIHDVQTTWTGFGPGWMGNKCAVGVRFRVGTDAQNDGGEIMTFVCTHMTAHAHNLRSRLSDWEHIVKTLLFPRAKGQSLSTNIYDTSHLFVFGDMNFRLDTPQLEGQPLSHDTLVARLATPEGRSEAREWDQLRREIKAGNVLHGLREGDFWNFQPSYKYILGERDAYSKKRAPAWTDRILFTTYLDSPSTPDVSYITPLLYTSVQSYTTSDHKPIVALLRVPSALSSTLTPMLYYHENPPFQPAYRMATFKKSIGKALGWVVGWVWCLLWFFGVGHAGVGLGNFVLGAGAAALWTNKWLVGGS